MHKTIIPHTIRRSQRARHPQIRISAKGVEVILPKRFPARQVPQMLLHKKTWIEKHWQRMQSGLTPERASFSDHAPFLYQGKVLTLHIQQQASAVLPCCVREGDMLKLTLPAGCPKPHIARYTKDALALWLTRQLEAEARRLIAHFTAVLGQEPSSLVIRALKSQWGSCNHRRVICLNFSLIFAPPEVLAYVVAHEMAHLLHMNHSAVFWETVAGLVPDYRARRAWLRRQGALMEYFC